MSRVCEIAQTIQLQGQSAPVAQVAIGRPAPAEEFRMVIVFSHDLSFLSGGVKVIADDKDGTGIELPWRRCLPGGCAAEATAKEDVLSRWCSGQKSGRILFKNAGGVNFGTRSIACGLTFATVGNALGVTYQQVQK